MSKVKDKQADKPQTGSKPNLGTLRAPKLEDHEEGTSEHVGEDSNLRSSYKSGAANMKKGKILVDLKHSGDYKAFGAAEKNVTTKMMTLKESIRKDPLSIFTPELTEGIVMALGDTAFYRPEKPVQALSKNIGEYSMAGFDNSNKTKQELPDTSHKGSSQNTNNLAQRPTSGQSKQSSKSKTSAKPSDSKKKKAGEPIAEAKKEDSDDKNEGEEEDDDGEATPEDGEDGEDADEEGGEEAGEEADEEEQDDDDGQDQDDDQEAKDKANDKKKVDDDDF